MTGKGVKSTFDLWLRFWYLKGTSRPLRIEYEGAWYHVMNRARRSDWVFEGGNDYLLFIDLLEANRGLFNEPGSTAIYLARILRKDSLMDISSEFNLTVRSAVSFRGLRNSF